MIFDGGCDRRDAARRPGQRAGRQHAERRAGREDEQRRPGPGAQQRARRGHAHGGADAQRGLRARSAHIALATATRPNTAADAARDSTRAPSASSTRIEQQFDVLSVQGECRRPGAWECAARTAELTVI
ncbi:hypothetical protein [Streptomyces sp. NPDC048665]|uniref:hypothetical protein n=1 Tax=Streptomyces sp. NPDC048665 TaxID=3155490 RepID=UPI00343F16B7